MPEIQVILQGFWSNEISRSFSIVIVFIFFFALFSPLFSAKNSKISTLIPIAPGILSSLGILGTFVGVFFGLLDFDIRNINQSLPELLEGLKIAFGTSILGLTGAVLLRVLNPILSTSVVNEEAGISDIVESINDLQNTINEGHQICKQGFDAMTKAITDDGDSSITGQLQRLRTNISDLEKTSKDGFNRQIDEFKKFAEHMSKAFSEAIIEELKSVIHEFNDKISEQFGDNFKQLNNAVGQLLEWQENYKDHIEKLEDSFETALQSVHSSKESLEQIVAASSNIPEHMEKLNAANENLLSQLNLLYEGLNSIQEMREKAEGAIPDIAAKIDQMTETISTSVETQSTSVETTQELLEETVSNLTANIEAVINDQKESQQQMIEGLQSSINETLQNTAEQLNQSVVQLDESMQEEIGKVMQTMAENLSGIAQQFVDDYEPLLSETRKIVELSKTTKPRARS